MKNIIEDYLKQNIDEEISIKYYDATKELPIFLLEKYSFYKLNILGEDCMMLEIINNTPGIEELKKHLKRISNITDKPLILLFKSISNFRRKSLIANRIAFLVEDGQMYLPFLGLELKKIMKERLEDINIEKFTATTQVVFLYFLYNKNIEIDAKGIANLLNASLMTATRALNELQRLGLLKYEIGGITSRSKIYKRVDDVNYYRIGSQYLRNPINKVVYIEKLSSIEPIAGLDALALQSMINPPKVPVRAIYRKDAKQIEKNFVNNIDKINDMKLIELEIWDYDPNILAQNNIADIVSIVMSMKESNDERIQIAIEERLKGESWFTE